MKRYNFCNIKMPGGAASGDTVCCVDIRVLENDQVMYT
jgi:hypothetical protein